MRSAVVRVALILSLLFGVIVPSTAQQPLQYVIPCPTGDRCMAVTANITGGATLSKLRNLVGTVTSVKTTAGTLYDVTVVNTSGATAFVQIFNVAVASVTLGTTTPDFEVQCANGATCSATLPTMGQAMSNAISAASTTAEGGGTGSASGVQVFIQYY